VGIEWGVKEDKEEKNKKEGFHVAMHSLSKGGKKKIILWYS
jgi:hypothetical protein